MRQIKKEGDESAYNMQHIKIYKPLFKRFFNITCKDFIDILNKNHSLDNMAYDLFSAKFYCMLGGDTYKEYIKIL